jgi:hypothetical protein
VAAGGRKVSDGKTVDRAFPASTAAADYELVRIGGFNGCTINPVATTDTERTRALEADPAAIYSIPIPSGVNPAPGDVLFWAAPASTFQKSSANLQATAGTGHGGAQPCFFVTAARSLARDGTSYVIRGRVLNGSGYWS